MFEVYVVFDIVDVFVDVSDDDIGDDLLWLIFMLCYLVLLIDVCVVLMLWLFGGLMMGEIVWVFLMFELMIV